MKNMKCDQCGKKIVSGAYYGYGKYMFCSKSCFYEFEDNKNSKIRENTINYVKGKSYQFIENESKDKGWIVRLVEEDGVNYMITDDIKLNRINVRVRDGIVYDASIG